MNDVIQSLANLDPLWIYAVIFSISFIENVFPPSPSDVVVVFGGALAALGRGNFFIALICGVVGSTLGFMAMYAVGRWFGTRIIEAGKLGFISINSIHKAEDWFARYGDLIIVANRFLSGTRAVISFFAGVSRLNLLKTIILSFVSSLAWYSILVYAGYSLGNHWRKIYGYLFTYSQVVIGTMVMVILIIIVRKLLSSKAQNHKHD